MILYESWLQSESRGREKSGKKKNSAAGSVIYCILVSYLLLEAVYMIHPLSFIAVVRVDSIDWCNWYALFESFWFQCDSLAS